MKRFACVGLPIVLAATVLWADDRTQLYSDPEPPPREVLDRLNLKQEWRTYVPMDGRKDGFISIQLADGQMFVQTRSGMVAVLDAETGRILWHTTFGKSYQASFPLAINSFAVYAVNGGTIYALDRTTGAVKWKFRQPEGLSTAPVADDVQMYLSTGSGRMYGYFLPVPSSTEGGKTPSLTAPPPPTPDKSVDTTAGSPYASPPGSDKEAAVLREPQPTFSWEAQTHARLKFTPLMSYESLLAATPTGTIVGVSKYPFNSAVPEVYRIKLDGPIAAAPGHFDDVLKNGQVEETAYVGDDTNVYAIGVSGGKQRWRFTVGTAVLHQPIATAEDVYVTTERNGMFRLSRTSGEPQWRIKRGNRNVESNADADRLLAVNPKFVYATDKSNRLLILDRNLGTEVSSYNTRDFAFPVSNEMNDRLYLAANSGLIVCLHDKEYTKPYFHQKQTAGGIGRSPEDRIKLAKDNLARKISHPGFPDPMPLREAIERLRKNYGVQIFSSDGVFTRQNLAPINDKPVTVPKVDNVPLEEFIKKILAQVGATFELTADVLQVVPLKVKPPPDKDKGPGDKGPGPMPPDAKPPG
jgi:outer membrane protein assembly factor BamB